MSQVESLTRLSIPERLRTRIACPACHGRLVDSTNQLSCDRCDIPFVVAADGSLPILLMPDSDLANPQYAHWVRKQEPGTRKKGYRERKRLPQTNVTDMDREIREEFFRQVGEGTILNLGSGERSVHVGERWVGLDIAPHANCDVVGDAHHLPFQDASFDAVHTVSVFEHLRKPWIAAEEVARVLRPGGLLFCSVPFAYPIHGSPHDFFRYTSEGLASLFESLEVIEIVPGRGPISSIGLYCERVADAAFPGKFGFIARWMTAWAIQPFKYADPWLTRKNPDGATSFTLFARKPE